LIITVISYVILISYKMFYKSEDLCCGKALKQGSFPARPEAIKFDIDFNLLNIQDGIPEGIYM